MKRIYNRRDGDTDYPSYILLQSTLCIIAIPEDNGRDINCNSSKGKYEHEQQYLLLHVYIHLSKCIYSFLLETSIEERRGMGSHSSSRTIIYKPYTCQQLHHSM